MKKDLFVFYLSFLFITSIGFAQLRENESISEKRAAELKYLLRHDCGSCHGMLLKGGLGPALTDNIIGSKSDQLLFETIKMGRGVMPPWKNLLSDQEILWLVGFMKRGGEGI